MVGDRKQDPSAPGYELPELISQEESFVFDSFTQSDATRLGEIMISLGRELGMPFACKIYFGEMVVFQYVPEGTGRINEVWMEKKIRTVMLTGWSTMRVWAMHEMLGKKRDASMLPNGEYVMCGGGFPIRVSGLGVVGAIACSGAGDQDEHEFCQEALRRLRL